MTSLTLALRLPTRPNRPATPLMPGVALCSMVAAGAYGAEAVERAAFGQAPLEPLVLAILLGSAVRTLHAPEPRFGAGIAFSAKYLLEAAVVLLGATLSAGALLAAGPALLAGIAAVVAIALPLGFVIGRALGLPSRMALLVACGNAICGNSAIAAVAPVIGADAEEVAASIAFTALLGVGTVLGLPALGLALHMNGVAFGAFAGLTVYAVPQVLAATGPLGTAAVQMGTLVKLVRVLALGPVCLVLSLLAQHFAPRGEGARAVQPGSGARAGYPKNGARGGRPKAVHLVPPFILGFLLLAACRAYGLVPDLLAVPLGRLATLLTVVSMAALGLGVDVRSVASAGGRVAASALLCLLLLAAVSLALLRMLGLFG